MASAANLQPWPFRDNPVPTVADGEMRIRNGEIFADRAESCVIEIRTEAFENGGASVPHGLTFSCFITQFPCSRKGEGRCESSSVSFTAYSTIRVMRRFEGSSGSSFFVRVADAALYRAMANGRNRVEPCSGDMVVGAEAAAQSSQ